MTLRALYLAIPAAVLAACSNGSSPSVSGTVLGSYVRNAVVCMDANRNGRCDGSEYSMRTDNNGNFTLPAISGADLVAEIGTDATRFEPSDGSVTPVTAKAVFRIHSALAATGTRLSALSTIVSAEMDGGLSASDALQKVATRVGVDAGKLMADFNTEADAQTQGSIKAYANRTFALIQDAVKAGGTADDLKSLLNAALVTPSTQKGTVKYVWTQFGVDEKQPFSRLEVVSTTGSNTSLIADPTKVASTDTFTFATDPAGGDLYGKGSLFARAIVVPDAAGNASCPQIRIDGVASAMSVRASTTTGQFSNAATYGTATAAVDFPVLTCEAAIPDTARSAAINGQPLKVVNSASKINRVVVMGDTGCRLKGPTAFTQAADGTATGGDPLQDCTSEAAWPLAKLAKVAASFDPDVLLHNGDLHYREGFPVGTEKRFGGAANAANGGYEFDTQTIYTKFQAAKIDDSITFGWRAWEEDFFKASGPLLGTAPWAITRGNHESCDRAGQGWFRFLDPRRFPSGGEPAWDTAYKTGSSFSVSKNCSQYIDPVSVVLGDLQLVLLDVGMLADDPGKGKSLGWTLGDHVRTARQLNAVSALPASKDPSKVTWIVSHKPLFAYAGSKAVASNAPQPVFARTWAFQKALIGGNESVGAGNGTLPANTQMTHAGHIHGFQMISHPAANNMPINVLMGTSGDNLEGLIEANSGTAPAALGWANNITGGAWPWLDQTVNGVLVAGQKWFIPGLKDPQNFSSSTIVNVGKKETAGMSEFSFLVLDRVGSTTDWKMKVYDINRKLLRTCTTSGKTASCDG